MNTHFTLKLQDWGLYHVTKVLSLESLLLTLFTLLLLETLNGLITVWSILLAYMLHHCCLLVTGMFELNEIHSLAPPSGPSNVTQDYSSVKINWKKSTFIYFLAQFWRFKMFAFVRGGCLWSLIRDSNSQSNQHILFVLTSSIPAFSNIWK